MFGELNIFMVKQMKNLLKKIPKKVKSFLVGVVAMGALLPTMLPGLGNMVIAAGPHFNDNAQDRPTLQVTNYTTSPDGYGLSTTVKPGDQVAFKVYIHNNEPDTVAYATKVLASVTNGYSTSHTGTATISANNASSVTGSATISSSVPVKLTFVENTTRRWWFTDSSMQYVQYEVMPNTILGNGITIGDLNGCWQWIQYVTFVFNVEAEPESEPFRVQGYFVDENLNAIDSSKVEVALNRPSDGWGQTSVHNNPYTFSDVPYGADYKLTPSSVSGYEYVGYTKCENATSCHNNTPISDQNAVLQPSTSTEYFDVWWHYKKSTAPALTIAKTVASGANGTSFSENVTAQKDDVVTFKLLVTNNGTSNANDTTVSDQLPSGLEYVSGSTKVDTTQDTSNALIGSGINVGSLGAGKSVTVTFEAKVTANTAQTVTNTGLAKAQDVNQVGDTATVTIQEPNQPAITIAKTVSLGENSSSFGESVNANNDNIVRFRLIVTSTGDGTASSVNVWDSLPSGLTYVDGSTTLDGASQSGSAIVGSGLSLGNMAENVTHTVIFNARVNTNNVTLTNYGRASINGTSQVEDTATVIVGGTTNATLTLDKQVSFGENGTSYSESVSAEEGDYVRFRMVVSNTGSARVENVEISDDLPSSLTYVLNSTYVDGVRQDNSIVNGELSLDNMEVGTTRTVIFNATVNTSANTTVTNEATVTADNAASVQDTARVQINGSEDEPYLEVSKEVSDSTVEPGDEVEYTIRVTNTGDGDATNVRIVDDLPNRLNYVSDTLSISSDGDVEDDDLFGDGVIIDRLQPDEDVVIRYTARVDSDTSNGTTLENTVVARDDEGDRAEDQAVIEAGRGDEAYLNIDKQVNKSKADPGDELRYTITVRNTGDGEAANVRIYDDLPDYVEVVDDSLNVSGDHITSRDLFDNYVRASYLEEDEEITISYRVKIRSDLTRDVTLDNVARVTADGGLKDRDVASTYVGANVQGANVKLTKMVRNETQGESSFNQSTSANPGNVLEYKISLANNGTTTLSGVKLNDILPSGIYYLGGTAKASLNNSDLSGDWNMVVEQGGVVLPDLPANSVFTLIFKAKSKTDIANNSTLVNTVNVVADQDINAQATASVSFTQIAQPVVTTTKTTLPDTGPGVAVAGFVFMSVSAVVWFLREKWLLAAQMM